MADSCGTQPQRGNQPGCVHDALSAGQSHSSQAPVCCNLQLHVSVSCADGPSGPSLCVCVDRWIGKYAAHMCVCLCLQAGDAEAAAKRHQAEADKLAAVRDRTVLMLSMCFVWGQSGAHTGARYSLPQPPTGKGSFVSRQLTASYTPGNMSHLSVLFRLAISGSCTVTRVSLAQDGHACLCCLLLLVMCVTLLRTGEQAC